MNAIYLASGSPRRGEILENLGFTVRRLPADIDETPKEGEAAVEYVRRMACEKIRRRWRNGLLLMIKSLSLLY